MEDYKTLCVLEDRMKKLEAKIVAKIPLDDAVASNFCPILSALLEIDTVLISKLSGRDKIGILVEKVNILEQFCNPSFLETHFNAATMLETVLASVTDLLYLNEELQHIDELKPVLDQENIERLPSLSERINKITAVFLNIKKECDFQTAMVKKLTLEYKKSLTELSKLFIEVENLISKLENDSKN